MEKNEELQKNIEDLEAKHKNCMDEVKDLGLQNSDVAAEFEKLESALEEERARRENCEEELERFSEFIQDLQEELRTKQDTVVEWNEAVAEVESKLLRLTEENKVLRRDLEEWNFKYNELLAENHYNSSFIRNEGAIKLLEQIFQVELAKNMTQENLVKILEDGKKEIVGLRKDKNMYLNKLQELTEKHECLKNLYENQTNLSKENSEKFQSEIAGFQKKNLEISYSLSKKNEKIKNLKKSIESLTEALLALRKNEANYKIKLEKQAKSKVLLKEKDDELQQKSLMISNLEKRIDSIEQSSISELEFLKNGIESLKECFQLEISKKEQEAILKFQNSASVSTQKEEEYIEEIQRIEGEYEKMQTHYKHILLYKEEEKNILEKDRVKLRAVIKELEEKLKEVSDTIDLQDLNLSFFGKRGLTESNANIDKLFSKSQIGRKMENSGFAEEISRKKELDDCKAKFEERLRKKTQETQERIFVWKNKIREDLSALKKYFVERNMEKVGFLIEKIERTVSVIL